MSNDPEHKKYEELLREYRLMLQKIRYARRHEPNESLVRFIDGQRDRIHKELFSSGLILGKSREDVYFDILVSEKDLSEHGLPEFKVIRTENVLDYITWIRVIDKKGASISEYKKSYDSQKGYIPKEIEIFIPFGEVEYWHLFEKDDYAFRNPDYLERRRRLFRLIDLTHGDSAPTEIHSRKTFHQAITLFGASCSSQNLGSVLNVLESHRSELSIDGRFFLTDQLRNDFNSIIEEDLALILSHSPDDQGETEYLIGRFENVFLPLLLKGVANDYINDARHLIAEARKKAGNIERNRSIEVGLNHAEAIEFDAQNHIHGAEQRRSRSQRC